MSRSFRNGIKRKEQKDKEGKAADLKASHRDVIQMKELLIGALYPFPPA